nr:MAG TPA: hypothetical protein [Ackermannviridae sp.]
MTELNVLSASTKGAFLLWHFGSQMSNVTLLPTKV